MDYLDRIKDLLTKEGYDISTLVWDIQTLSFEEFLTSLFNIQFIYKKYFHNILLHRFFNIIKTYKINDTARKIFIKIKHV